MEDGLANGHSTNLSWALYKCIWCLPCHVQRVCDNMNARPVGFAEKSGFLMRLNNLQWASVKTVIKGGPGETGYQRQDQAGRHLGGQAKRNPAPVTWSCFMALHMKNGFRESATVFHSGTECCRVVLGAAEQRTLFQLKHEEQMKLVEVDIESAQHKFGTTRATLQKAV